MSNNFATAVLEAELPTAWGNANSPTIPYEEQSYSPTIEPMPGDAEPMPGDAKSPAWRILEPVHTALEAWRGSQNEIETQLLDLFGELDHYRDRFHNEELKLREERLHVAEMKTQLAYERADWEAEQQESGCDVQHKIRDLERERTELEIELESIRNRAAELTDQLTEQKRHLNKERESWTNEFRQLRQTLEKQSQLLAQRVVAPVVDNTPRSAAEQTTVTGAGTADQSVQRTDPLVGSVKSQFQMLQNDIARRRAQLKKPD